MCVVLETIVTALWIMKGRLTLVVLNVNITFLMSKVVMRTGTLNGCAAHLDVELTRYVLILTTIVIDAATMIATAVCHRTVAYG